jgi:hypothetical protein
MTMPVMMTTMMMKAGVNNWNLEWNGYVWRPLSRKAGLYIEKDTR